jgi:multidrug resistance efflux pump
LAEIALAAEEFDYEQFLERQKLDQESAKRARDAARQAYDNYQKVDRELEIKQAENSLESSKFSLESATEEYEQLKKMYEEDDLTEESEEIVLRRAKRAMERAEFSLERAQVQHDRTIKQTIPRRDAEQEETLAKAMLDYDNTIKDIQSARQKRALEMEKKRRDFADQKSKVDEMREERKRVVLKAPMDGIFLHGKLTRGKLPAKPATIEQGATVPANQTFATIVHPNRLRVRIDLPEQHVALARTSDRCKVIPTGTTDVELDGKLSSVSSVPFATGKFDCVVSLQGKVPEYIVPTMTCAVQMTPKADDATPAESKPAK